MRQEHQYKEDRTHQHQGSKDTQVAQGWCVEWHQAGEGTHRGDVTDQQRCHHLFEDLPGSTATTRMGDKVQRIVHGDTDNDRADTDHNQRHITADHRHQSHGEQPAEGDGGTDEQEVLHLLECKHQQGENQGDGNGTSINLNSLQMMSYPASPDYCNGYKRITVCDSYFDDYYKWNKDYMKYKFIETENLYPGSCFYTGDTSSNSPYIWNTLMNKMDHY